MSSSIRPLVASGLALALLGLAGCQDDEPASTTSNATSPPPEISASVTSEPSDASPSPTVAPATGPELRLEISSVRAPEGWKLDDPLTTMDAGASPGGLSAVSLFDTDGLGLDNDLDEIARFTIKGLPEMAKATRQPDVLLGEEEYPAVFITYTVPDRDERLFVVRCIRDNRSISLDINLTPDVFQANPHLVASILASFDWI